MGVFKQLELIRTDLSKELKRLYHNATLTGKLRTESDFESDLFQSRMEFEIEVAFQDLNDGLIPGLESFTKKYGEVFSYGRGGRTVAPSCFIESRGFSWKIKRLEDLEENFEDLETLLNDLKVFNDFVINWCSSVPDQVIEQNREENFEDLEKFKDKKRRTRTVVSYE